MTYKHATVAGTFDHFHAGHRFLLHEVFLNSEKVSLGITAQEMTADKVLANRIESYDERKKNLELYLHEENFMKRSHIFTLTDIYGIALEDATLEAIYTTPETVANAETINQLRKEKDLPELVIVTIPLLEGDDEQPISSTRIRLGEINRDGTSYLLPFKNKQEWEAPVLVRDELRVPIGEMIQGDEKNRDIAAKKVIEKIHKDKPVLVIAVGDIVTKSLHEQKYEPDISFVDHRSRREELENMEHKATEKHGPYKNKAGTINSSIVKIYGGLIQETIYLKDHNQIVVQGEEDLLGLPAIMLAPPGSVVVYGQFDEGIVYVPVTEEIKFFCYEMLQRFV